MWSLSARTALTKRELNRQGTRGSEKVASLRSYNQDTTYDADGGASDSSQYTKQKAKIKEEFYHWLLELMMPREGRWKGDEWHMRWGMWYDGRRIDRDDVNVQQPFLSEEARKVGLELGQSTSLLERAWKWIVEWGWIRWSMNVQLVANKHKMKKHCTVHSMTKWR